MHLAVVRASTWTTIARTVARRPAGPDRPNNRAHQLVHLLLNPRVHQHDGMATPYTDDLAALTSHELDTYQQDLQVVRARTLQLLGGNSYPELEDLHDRMHAPTVRDVHTWPHVRAAVLRRLDRIIITLVVGVTLLVTLLIWPVWPSLMAR